MQDKKGKPRSDKREKTTQSGAILLGWGDSLLRDMLDAGVFDCLNSEFDVATVTHTPSLALTLLATGFVLAVVVWQRW